MPTAQIRMDEATKEQASEIFRQLGTNMSDAVVLFLRQVILQGGLPFSVTLPRYNARTTAALEDAERSRGKGILGKDVSSLLAELKEDSGETEE